MKITHRYPILLTIFLVSFHGCAHPIPDQSKFESERTNACQDFLACLGEAVNRSGVLDASSPHVAGFPYLRANRFLSALKCKVKNREDMDEWVGLMQKLNIEATSKEVSNLPKTALAALEPDVSKLEARSELINRAEFCSDVLLQRDRSRTNFLEILRSAVQAPDEYSLLLRAAGLYPLTVIPIDIVSEKVRMKFRRWYSADMKDLPVEGQPETFVHLDRPALAQQDIKHMLLASMNNPLRVPLLSNREQLQLVKFFAPVYVQDVAASYDIPGFIARRGNKVIVDTKKPTVYYYFSHAFLMDMPIIQINYVVWYERRAGRLSPWLERGRFDGSTARISLDAEGRVFMVDMMNNCGCYHFFVPSKQRIVQFKDRCLALDPFVPQWLPDVSDGERLAFRINSGWHQVEHVFADRVTHSAISYDLVPYDTLEALPDETGQTKSIFNSKGILQGSERIEPFILFSSGIPSIGSMRQRGHHAIEITGRAMFDDPRLFDDNFVFSVKQPD